MKVLAVIGDVAAWFPPLRPLRPTFTRLALPMSMMDPACVLMLDGRLGSLDLDHGSFGSTAHSESVECPNVAADGDGETLEKECPSAECSSLKGLLLRESSCPSSTSLTTSAGPNEVDAKGELAGSRGTFVLEGDRFSFDPLALITSALTTPKTCRTAPLVGVMIMGASLRKSLE